VPPLPRLPDPRLDGAVASGLAEQSAFLRIERLRLTVSGSTPFNYDVVTRKALDAVVIAAHFRVGGKVQVMLRSALRPPVWWRERGSPMVWELPAGLVEPNESPREAAARELFEEVGARVEPATLEPLGPPMLPAPGMIAEVQAFFHVAIDPHVLTVPEGDSSALENASTLYACALDEALALCASGAIRDLKTELGLRRLAEVAHE
jgi:ADP-ribose pyrophosphatase